MNIDWKAIRPLNGSRANGFEQLCAQLADAVRPPGSHFKRKGPPDAGVECYAVLSDGTEWGWQAKYFDGLSGSQWSQLDESIKTAIEKHPRLVRYFVCVPLDRPDARVGKHRSAMERWDQHVEKWTKWASNRGMAVEFVYWGSHELLELMARPQHSVLARIWFDVRGFDDAWFAARLDKALRASGPRYAPEIHVDLPIAQEFEAFGRTERFFDRIKAHARQIREKLRSVQYSEHGATEPNIGAEVAAISTKVQVVLAALGSLEPKPIGSLPFKEIANHAAAATGAAEEFAQLLAEREREQEAQEEATNDKKANSPSYRSNPFRDRRFQLLGLSSELRKAREALNIAERMAGGALMLLRGDAGTGKTHLLCDVARQRVTAGRPTVLLMGQQFLSNDAPWTQVLQQLDMPGLSAEEFVGALESAAQAAGSRALLLIDALNEGAGRTIWPNHLAAFLAYLERSPWIGVVLSVRSSYEEIIVPEEVRACAATVTHQGFTEHEYDATRTFFVHYGLELPSTPLLAPEFRNPLFLKTLCRGLQEKGERRLPRGLHGITAIFNLYLDAVNESLAKILDFNPKKPLTRRALEAFAQTLVDSGTRWLTLSKAEGLVNALLPGRTFEQSLYRGLVVEGVLLQEVASWRQSIDHEEVVSVAYERFADHFAAKTLLDRHLDAGNPASAFAPGGRLAFLYDESEYVAPGLLEALCIQIPERTRQELISLAPGRTDCWRLGDAFRQSLIWRALSAFSSGTHEALDKLCRNDHDLHETLDALVTVATLPGHPFNALFLDQRLKKDTMPERDAWWSVYLHQAWNTHGAVDRLVDWASSVTPDMALDDEPIDLCAMSLAWMLTTSNRFLRDRATKALVSLLTGRLGAVTRLVERFADVDDPYVAERVYAVAYGTAMRCHDPAEVGNLAASVYARVFAAGSPPPHILLRDYARGVVERSLHLGSDIEVAAERIRPPYGSQWPTIPSEDDIKPLLPGESEGSHDSGDLKWGRNRIGNSVMEGDFAGYVIDSTNWLSLKLKDPAWVPPARPEDLLHALVSEFSADEHNAWEQFDEADQEYDEGTRSFVSDWFAQHKKGVPSRVAPFSIDNLLLEMEKSRPPEYVTLEKKRQEALGLLGAALTEEHSRRLEEIRALEAKSFIREQPPHFDLRQIQRYIIWRVFEIGWTTERFGYFDRFSIGYNGGTASKAERIGKKYQWIAYHEIRALVADHFQYLELPREGDRSQVYDGPWQEGLRDIDPSCTLRSTRGETGWDGHTVAWWGSARYDDWGDLGSSREWVLRSDDLPRVEELLLITNPNEGTKWLNGQSYLNWKQQTPADLESTDVERREIWYICTGYLIRKGDAQDFLKWAEGVSFWGRWMPKAAEISGMFLGEHGWSPASRYFQQQYYGDNGWTQPGHGCPVKIRSIAFEYLREAGGFDCSVDETYTLRLPVSELVTGLGIRWSGSGADLIDDAGRLAAQDPSVHADGPSALLLREDLLREFLAREKLTICWAVIGEKRVVGAGLNPNWYASLRMSGAFGLGDKGPTGFLKCMVDKPKEQDRGSVSDVVAIIRTAPDDLLAPALRLFPGS